MCEHYKRSQEKQDYIAVPRWNLHHRLQRLLRKNAGAALAKIAERRRKKLPEHMRAQLVEWAVRILQRQQRCCTLGVTPTPRTAISLNGVLFSLIRRTATLHLMKPA